MNREKLLNDAIAKLKMLPEDKVILAHDFTEFLYHKYEEYILREGVQNLVVESESFKFLKNDEDIYTVNDIKGKYNAER